MIHVKKTHVITVYRGQLISRVEVRKLQKNTPHFFTNSFFSTTMNRHLALILLNPSLQRSDDVQSVLFEIKIDLTLKSSQPYADISPFSQFPSETEVLFSYGTEFQVTDVEYSQTEHIWIIKLSFVEGGSKHMWNILELGSHSYFDEEDNEGDETKILRCMGSRRKMLKQSLSLAHQTFAVVLSLSNIRLVFKELLNLFESEQWLLAIEMRTLAFAYTRDYMNRWANHDLKPILKYYENAIKLWLPFIDDQELNSRETLADICRDLAEVFELPGVDDPRMVIKYYRKAVEYYQQMIVIEEKVQGKTDLEIKYIEHQIASIEDKIQYLEREDADEKE
ncbi:unnamed protein product [Didymodactylos carnosus]|uniref:ADP ribosyltransferase domain-containing protein n=1 Tax=Didymodactylos carnosus TaxID=1234261 RepID=A0A8S2DE30_9BILA|nr:unnamed protein product [Didymodactylos carnosus]CAF3655588.1 unnamed protein product [Didymodactylos carnosus]